MSFLTKRVALLAVIGAALMTLPSTAAAQAPDCSGVVGTTSSGDICVYESTTGAGGELVIRPPGCSYVNAWRGNPVTEGYAGICTAATPDPACDAVDNGSGANTGGCFYIAPTGTVINNAVTAMVICGNTRGEDPKATTRDGCSPPTTDD